MKDWKKIQLMEMCNLFTDGDWIEAQDQDTWGIRLIQTGNIGCGMFKDKPTKARYINKETFKKLKCQSIFPGDCLIARLPDPVGRACIIPDCNQDMITAVDCTIVRFDESIIIPPFFIYYSQFPEYLYKVNSLCTGTTRKRISRKNLGKIEILLPPLEEQKRIVAILDEAFEGIDAAIANTQKNLANARELFDSYLNNIFTRKGEGWVEKKLGEDCEIIMGQSPDGSSYNTEGIGVPLINGPVEFGGIEPFAKTVATKFTTKPTKMCKEGDLILCVRGSTTGRMNIAGQKACIGRGVAAIRSKNNQDWVNQFIGFSRNKIYTLGSGSTFPNVSSSELRKIIIPFPPKEKQDNLVGKMESLATETQRLEAIYQRKLEALQELKQSILQKAFTGELTSDTVKETAETSKEAIA